MVGDRHRSIAWAYVRFGSSWAELGSLTPSQVAAQDFGTAVALDGGTAFVGSSLDDIGAGQDAGRAYVFDVSDDWCSCLSGNVNSNLGAITNVLFVNASLGGPDRRVPVEGGELIFGSMALPPTGGVGKYVVHGNLGAPNSGTASSLPADVGDTCFEMILGSGASPDAVWNNIGKENLVGPSDYFGTPIANPQKAPAVFLELKSGDAVNLPPGTELTMQGVILDQGAVSPKGASVTNAVILCVE